MAVTGPFARTLATQPYYKYQQWYRQGLPRQAPLAYRMNERRWTPIPNSIGLTGGNAGNSDATTEASSPAYTAAYNRAYAKLKDSVGEAASLAVNLAERKQAVDMMTSRVHQILRFARAVRNFRFGEAATVLGLQVVTQSRNSVRVKAPQTELRKRRSWARAKRASGPFRKKGRIRPDDDTVELRFKRRASAFGNNFLEYHFGWEPLIKDIGATIDILNDPITATSGRRVRVGATHKVAQPAPDTSDFSTSKSRNWRSGVSLQANVVVTNPNLRKAEQLGLINPFVIVWELVPFSFVVDWFTSFGDYLASLTDFAGVNLVNASTSHFCTLSETYRYRYYGVYYPYYRMDHVWVVRTVGISGPTIAMKAFKLPSLTRGLTAVSLLTSFLRKV